MIRKITTDDIRDLAQLHRENLPSFLGAFPLSFIRKFYRRQLQRENQVLLGAFENEKMLGFVFGTEDVDQLFGDFIAENRFYFYCTTFKTLILHPKYLMLFLGKFFLKSHKSPCKRQLVYIAVDSASGGKKGIGKKLLSALESEWHDVNYYELEVDRNNRAHDFYTKNGFFPVSKQGRKHLLGKNLKQVLPEVDIVQSRTDTSEIGD